MLRSCLCFLLITSGCFVNRIEAQTNFVTGYLYVKVKDTWQVELAPYDYSWSGINKAFLNYGVVVTGIEKPFPDTLLSKSLAKVYRIHYTDTLAGDSLVDALASIPCIEFAEKEPKIFTNYTPNDLHANQWYLNKISAKTGWDFGKGSASIKVAIVDNGVRSTHTDLAANIWTNPGEVPNNFIDDDLNGFVDDVHGYDVADGDNNPDPPLTINSSSPFNHGTHCAGICAATTDNGKGIASIGFKTAIIPVKCCSDLSDGNSLSDAYNGVYYAIKAKADVISMSFGSPSESQTGQLLMNTANAMGITLVAAAGNSGNNTPQYPAAYNHVIAVAASDENDKLAGFSNFGTYIDLVAPGVNIFSTLADNNNSYGFLSGTSMSAPLVAGLVALVKSRNPDFTPEELEAALKKGADNINAANPDKIGQIGAGRINAFKAVNPAAAGSAAIKDLPWLIYPNPATDFITIQSESEELPIASAVLISATGQEFKRVNEIQSSMYSSLQLDVSDVAPGVYFVKIKSKAADICLPVVVVR